VLKLVSETERFKFKTCELSLFFFANNYLWFGAPASPTSMDLSCPPFATVNEARPL
jgi:hypothetical protein